MKRLLISFFAATMLMGVAGFSFINRPADAPECCKNHESCCPNSSCCSGGSHSQCRMMDLHHCV
jgi:hypothetical protein